MDKTILRKFAIESKIDLTNKIETRINSLYIDEQFEKEQKGDIFVLSNEKHKLNLTKDEMDDRDKLAKRINEVVNRNKERFPKDFCFQLTETEYESLKYQFKTNINAKSKNNRFCRRSNE